MREKKSVKVQKRQHAPTYCSRGRARRRRGGRNTYICIRRWGSVLHVHAVGAAVVSVALFGMGPATVGVLLQQTTIDAVSFLNRKLISGGKKRKKENLRFYLRSVWLPPLGNLFGGQLFST